MALFGLCIVAVLTVSEAKYKETMSFKHGRSMKTTDDSDNIMAKLKNILFRKTNKPPVRATVWKNNGNKDDIFQLEEISMVPEYLVQGKPVKLKLKGYLIEDLTGDEYVNIAVHMNGMLIYNQTQSLCEALEELEDSPQCPIMNGDIEFERVQTIPRFVPTGKYRIELRSRKGCNNELVGGRPLFHLIGDTILYPALPFPGESFDNDSSDEDNAICIEEELLDAFDRGLKNMVEK